MLKLNRLSFTEHTLYLYRMHFYSKYRNDLASEIDAMYEDYIVKKLFASFNEFGFVNSKDFDCVTFTTVQDDCDFEYSRVNRLFFDVKANDGRCSNNCSCKVLCVDSNFLIYHVRIRRTEPDYHIIGNSIIEGSYFQFALISFCAFYKIHPKDLLKDKEKLEKLFKCLENVKYHDQNKLVYVSLDI